MASSSEENNNWTVQRLLEWTSPFFAKKGVDSPRLCAELLLSHVLQVPRIKLYTDYQRTVPDAALAAYRDLVKRAAEQEPVAYLTGRAHFFSMEFEITRDVLIPRPDSETVVEKAIQLLRSESGLESPRVLDLCTGSGCIAAAIAQNIKTANLIATDVSPAAVKIARANVERLGLAARVTVLEGDLFDALDSPVYRQPFHLIVGNPPYIPTAQIAELDASVREFEPVSALDGGLDGLALHRKILREAAGLLLPGGQLLLEIAFDQGELARQVAGDYSKYENVRIIKDYGGNDRILAMKLA